MSPWYKRAWVWIVGALALIAGIVIWLLTLGRVRLGDRKTPVAPKLPDVSVPKPVDLNTTPADDYEAEKVEPAKGGLVDSINERYK